MSCLRLYLALGLNKDNVVVFDKDGVINAGRTNLDPIQMQFATSRAVTTLEEAMDRRRRVPGPVEAANVVPAGLLLRMADNPIVFALANPDPEVSYQEAMATRDDLDDGDGPLRPPQPGEQRAGLPLHLPRGAGRAGHRNQRSHEAGCGARPGGAGKEPVPEMVNKAYGDRHLAFRARTTSFPSRWTRACWPL
jgi:malate dehydrogenase (oxaloacetate-decarboxylating)(NADP+)